MNKELNQYKQVFLMGLIVGIIIEVLGIASLVNYVINNSVLTYFLGGIGLIVVGMLFLGKSIPAFIPVKQQIAILKSCPHCGALQREKTAICEKCKQQLD
jgi:hypothetical protein